MRFPKKIFKLPQFTILAVLVLLLAIIIADHEKEEPESIEGFTTSTNNGTGVKTEMPKFGPDRITTELPIRSIITIKPPGANQSSPRNDLIKSAENIIAAEGCEYIKGPEYSNTQKAEDLKGPAGLNVEDPVIDYLGKSFDEIKQVLGKPDEQGQSNLYGPHYYMLYKQKEGKIRFGAPKKEDKIVISITLGKGQEVLETKVGMTFPEIKDTLEEPDFGPEPGMGNLYYMDYFWGETKSQIPKILVSFSAESSTSPTNQVFIKWEHH